MNKSKEVSDPLYYGLNVLIHRNCQKESKTRPKICCLKVTSSNIDTYRLKVKRWRNIYHANTQIKRSENSYINFRQSRLQSKEDYHG